MFAQGRLTIEFKPSEAMKQNLRKSRCNLKTWCRAPANDVAGCETGVPRPDHLANRIALYGDASLAAIEIKGARLPDAVQAFSDVDAPAKA